MTSSPAIPPLLNSSQLDAIHMSTLDTGVPFEIHGLDTACSFLGGTHAWVTRHAGGTCQLVNRLGSALEIDASLNALLVNASQNSRERPVLAVRWRNDTLLCASLSPHQEADGCTYMLNILFDGHFELTASLAGFVDGLRCSMQALISWQISKKKTELAEPLGKQTLSCTCCLRDHSFEHGWMQPDHQRNLRDVQGTFRTVCEKCALALYSVVLQD
jgi:hypothetical protein